MKYGTARFFFRLVMVSGWAVVAFGLVMALVIIGNSGATGEAIGAAIFGMGSIVIIGIGIVAVAHIGTAVLDTAENTSLIVEEMRKSRPLPKGESMRSEQTGGVKGYYKGQFIRPHSEGFTVDGLIFPREAAAQKHIDEQKETL